MSKFPKETPRSEGQIVGSVVHGAFECDVCNKVTTAAIWNRREEKLYWDCPDGHANQIHFKV